MTDETTTPGEVARYAWEQAREWAYGRLSHINEYMRVEVPGRRVETLAAIEQADAAEVVKWSALAVAAAQLEAIRHDR